MRREAGVKKGPKGEEGSWSESLSVTSVEGLRLPGPQSEEGRAEKRGQRGNKRQEPWSPPRSDLSIQPKKA